MSAPFDPPVGDPDAIGAAATLLHNVSVDLDDQRKATVKATTQAMNDWRGSRASEFSGAASGLAIQLAAASRATATASSALSSYATALREAISGVAYYARQAGTIQPAADQAAAKLPAGSPAIDTLYQHAATQRGVFERQALTAKADLATTATRTAAAIDTETAIAVPGGQSLSPDEIRRRVTAALGLSGLKPATTAAQAWTLLATPMALSTVPTGGTAQANAQWWAGLTDAERADLIAGDYRALKNMDGLPSAVLDSVNRSVLSDDVVSLTKQKALLESQGQTASAQYHLVCSELANAKGVTTALGDPGPALPGGGNAVVLLLHWDPSAFGGQGSAAIAYGNPDMATNTAVVVPGTSAKVSTMGVDSDAAKLFGAMGGPSNAVVAWLGYPAPPNLKDAASDSWAQQGTQPLIDALASLRVAHQFATGSDGHLTAIGHSYGSYELGRALTHGAQVDDAIFIGSPGVGVDNASGLNMSGAHVWDGRALDDPIAFADGRFTPDPETGNGPEDAGFGDQHFNVSGSHGHSEYYQGSSLLNMAAIADGNYNAVQRVSPPDLRGSVPAAINEMLREKFSWWAGGEDDIASIAHSADHYLRDVPIVGPVTSDLIHTDLQVTSELGKTALQVTGDIFKGDLKSVEDLGKTLDDVAHGDFGAAGSQAVSTVVDAGKSAARTAEDAGKGALNAGKDVVKGAGKVLSDLNPF